MNKKIEFIGWSSGLITIAATGIGLVWFFFGLDSRISTLENQMQAIYQSALTAPRNIVKENSGVSSSKTQTANNQLQKLVETCSSLALKTAAAYENGTSLSVAGPLEKMMDKLGCNKIQG